MFGSIETRQDSLTFNFSAFQNLEDVKIRFCDTLMTSNIPRAFVPLRVVRALSVRVDCALWVGSLNDYGTASATATSTSTSSTRSTTKTPPPPPPPPQPQFLFRLLLSTKAQTYGWGADDPEMPRIWSADDTSTSRAMYRTLMFGWTTVPFHKGVARKGQVGRSRDRVRVI